jgi:NADH dehydrogenase FAD-containing subunit
MAAYIKVQFPACRVSLVHSRDALLSSEPLPSEFKAKALDLLREGGVDVILGQRVLGETDVGVGSRKKALRLSGGQVIECDKVIYSAKQLGANTDFVGLSNENVDDKGCIRTRET